MAVILPHEKVESAPVVGVFILLLVFTAAFALFLEDTKVLILGCSFSGRGFLLHPGEPEVQKKTLNLSVLQEKI